MNFANPNEVIQFAKDATKAAEPVRQHIGNRIGINRCMFVGLHWMTNEMLSYAMTTTGRQYHGANLNPDKNKLRMVLERIPRFIHQAAAASFPSMMNFEVYPPSRDTGVEAMFKARVCSNVLEAFVKSTGFVGCARDANYRRCIDGLHGIGLCAQMEKKRVGNEYESDSVAKAFTFEAHRLVLDPGNQSLDLHDHDSVIYRDVWSVDKIRRVFGMTLDPNECKTFGQLMPFEFTVNAASRGALYTHLKEYSNTKAAIVQWVHPKNDSGVFGEMFVGVETASKPMMLLNWNNPESPFGGKGLPYIMLHGYREPDSMISRSDVSLLEADQKQINLLSTMAARVLQRYSGPQWLVDKNSIDGDGIDDWKSVFTNNVGGVIPYKGGTRDRPMQPPHLMVPPPPQPYLQDVISLHQERDMPNQVHRSPITVGATKSHVANESYQSALEAAGLVPGTRIVEDTERYEMFGEMLLGTAIKFAQKGSPTALSMLRRNGFDEADFAVLSQIDPAYPACDITLKKSSIKYRSMEQNEAKLDNAAKLQMITADDYRKAMADLDAPLTDEDRVYDTQAKRWATKVLLGEEWVPRSLGPAMPFFLMSFRTAMLDQRVERDPSALQRLDVAVQSMLAYANMEMMEQQMAMQPPAPAPTGQPEGEQAAEMPKEVSVVDLLTQIESGMGSGSSAQPQAA